MGARFLMAWFETASEGRVPEIHTGFKVNDRNYSVYFRSDDVTLEERPEALAAASLIPAMRTGENVKIDAILDSFFSNNLQIVQDLFNDWDDSFTPVRVLTGEGGSSVPEQNRTRVGLFFSGGVDSFFSLLQHQDEITDLIFVHGFDIHPDDVEHGRLAEESIRRVGEQFGKRVIKVETNVKSFLDSYAEWGEWAHGAAMASVAHLLPSGFSRVYISASDSGGELSPWGSHPDVATGQLDNLEALKEMPECRMLYRSLSVAFFTSRLREHFKQWRRRACG